MSDLTVTVALEVEVNERAWKRLYAQDDEYDRAEARASRSLIADVQDYVSTAISQSAAAREGAIVSVENFAFGAEHIDLERVARALAADDSEKLARVFVTGPHFGRDVFSSTIDPQEATVFSRDEAERLLALGKWRGAFPLIEEAPR